MRNSSGTASRSSPPRTTSGWPSWPATSPTHPPSAPPAPSRRSPPHHGPQLRKRPRTRIGSCRSSLKPRSAVPGSRVEAASAPVQFVDAGQAPLAPRVASGRRPYLVLLGCQGVRPVALIRLEVRPGLDVGGGGWVALGHGWGPLAGVRESHVGAAGLSSDWVI